VSYHNYGLALRSESDENPEYVFGCGRIKISGGFVSNEQGRIICHGSGYRSPLLLSS